MGFGNLWLSKRGTKGAVVAVVVRAFDYVGQFETGLSCEQSPKNAIIK